MKAQSITLNKIYALSGISPPDCQDIVHPTLDLLELFKSFCNESNNEKYDQIVSLFDNNQDITNHKDIKIRILRWLPDYGCVMISKNHNGIYLEKMDHISIVALDSWEFHICGENSRSFFSISDSSVELDSAIIHPKFLESFLERFDMTLSNIQEERSDEKRSARSESGNHGGHQRTPAFIDELIYFITNKNGNKKSDVSDINEKELKPKGGFTDVGLHTGGKKRNTTWSLIMGISRLVLHMLYDNSRDGDIHFIEMCIEFDLWIVSTFNSETIEEIKWKMEILQASTKKIYQAANSFGYLDKIKGYEQQCIALRKKLDEYLFLQAKNESDNWFLPKELDKITLCDIDIDIQYNSVSIPTNDINYDILLKDLGYIPLFPDISLPLLKVELWLNTIQEKNEYHLSHKIHYLNAWFSEHSKILENSIVMNDDTYVSNINNLLGVYSKLIQEYQKLKKINDVTLDVELKSNQVLITWICYCVIHKSCAQGYPLINEYGTCLDPRHLQHLVLSQKPAWDVVHRIINYLKLHGNKPPLFSLKNHYATFQFAEEFCEVDLNMKNIWRKEQVEAKIRINEQWNQVEKKKRRSIELKNQIFDLEKKIKFSLREVEVALLKKNNKERIYDPIAEKVQIIKNDISNLESVRIYSSNVYSINQEINQMRIQLSFVETSRSKAENEMNCARNEYNEANRIMKCYKQEKESKEKELEYEQMMPPPIYQPFPENEKLAYRIIFWMYMPNDLDILAKLSFQACAILMPIISLTENLQEVEDDEGDLSQRFVIEIKGALGLNEYQKYQKRNPFSPSIKKGLRDTFNVEFVNGSHKLPPEAKKLFPSHIDNCNSEKDARVWYPDIYFKNDIINMAWREAPGSETCINPFLIDDFVQQIGLHFTEKIKKEKSSMLNWALVQIGHDFVPKERSNISISRQDKKSKPDWLSKFEYFTYCSIRSYPYQQIRKICSSLHDESLPFNQNYYEISTLLKQSLFHIGEIDPENDKQPFLWKKDLFPSNNNESWFKILHDELLNLIDIYKNCPNEIFTLLLAGELCGFVSQWENSSSIGRKQIATAILEHSMNNEASINSTNEKESIESRKKICKYNIIGIFSYAIGDIDMEDAKLICKMMILAKKHNLTDSDWINTHMFHAKSVLSRLSSSLYYFINKDLSILTECVKLITESCPNKLNWNVIKKEGIINSLCFEATHDQKHFSINILSGVVLINGNPPGNLPLLIINHPKYKRVFGDRNFGTEVDSANVFLTRFSVNENHYSFHRTIKDKLIVKEINKGANRELELLDPPDETDENCWSKDLPIRLRMMHSHWVYWNDDTSKPKWIVFRGIKYLDRDIYFIALFENEMWNIYRVPFHMKSYDIERLLESIGKDIVEKMIFVDMNKSETSNDVEISKNFVDILEKFEERRFIEVYESYYNGIKKIKVALPRYKREFEICDDKLYSVDYSGYHLSKCQQLSDCLYKFTQYLVLEQGDGKSIKILIPDCDISCNKIPKLSISQKYDEELREYAYDIHSRLKNLKATSIASRLHLAAIFSSVNCKIPEKRTGMTGEEVAIELIRQSWVNRPLKDDESTTFKRIISVSAYSSPINLLCYELIESSKKLKFLHSSELLKPIGSTCKNVMEKKEYKTKDIHFWNPRSSLTTDEEWMIFGNLSSNRIATRRDPINLAQSKTIDMSLINRCPVTEFQIQDIEKNLELLLQFSNPNNQNIEFPIDQDKLYSKSQLSKNIIDDLQGSWDIYKNQKELSCNNIDVVLEEQQKIIEFRKKTEEYLLNTIDHIPYLEDSIYNGEHLQFRLKKIANFVPKVQLSDLLKIGVDKSLVLVFNPFLTPECIEYIHEYIRLWMELCVLEDRLERIMNWIKSNDEGRLIKELRNKRICNTKDHMEWLVFEVEGQLKIRPVQYTVAKSLIDSIDKNEQIDQGMITQLNMGEGKTRVIIPMLMLHFTKKSDCVVRLHFLGQLIHDAFDHLHQYICASVLNRKIFIMPFNRDVKMNEIYLNGIVQTLDYCKRSKGCICVTPESRLSMTLKWYEESSKNSEKTKIEDLLRRILFDVRYIDIFDESDEILRHKLQLIYAIGNVEKLPSGDSRWVAAECALKVFDKLIKSRKYEQNILSDKIVVEKIYNENKSFCKCRIVNGNEYENIKSELITRMAEEIVADPPYEFLWMTKKSQKYKKIMIKYISDPLIDEDMMQFQNSKFDAKKIADMRALRGTLAYENLFHCLQGRYRVTYGTKDNGEKRLAIPYRAADTPSDRSEYSHPDIAIIYTVLSYYHDGLTDKNVSATFELLMKKGSTEKENIYKEWYSISCINMKEKDKMELESIRMIDLTNSSQKEKICYYFRMNMKTIDYWLNNIVFPRDTKQFSKQLISTAWHLCDNNWKKPIGFSGTDDNKRLLPLQVKQIISADEELRATNGKMIYLMLKNESYSTIEVGVKEHLWESVIKHAVKEGDALIDAGGLMAGVSNFELAKYAIGLEGVKLPFVYFDTDLKEWRVRDKTNRIWSLSNSPIREKDAFVYFDDSRCRGADMKLLPKAVGILTIGPKMCKDKLMQAAGRMRQLDQMQQIKIISTQEVTKQIMRLNKLDNDKNVNSKHVLQWVMSNTIDSVALSGLMEWAKHGIHFCFTKSHPKEVAIECNTELETLYANAHEKKGLSQILYDIIDKFDCSNDTNEVKSEIMETIELFGKEFKQAGSSVDDECEKEIEQENEQEEEKELEVARVNPMDEQFLHYSSTLRRKEGQILNETCASSLSVICKSHFSNAEYPLEIIEWSSKVYCTKNFIITCQGIEDHIANYLRHIDAILYFKNSENVLLLAEGEADHILKLLLMDQGSFPHIQFLNMSYLKKIGNLQAEVVVSLKLFQGHTMFHEYRKDFELMINTKEKQHAALQLPIYRDLSHTINRSELDSIQFA